MNLKQWISKHPYQKLVIKSLETVSKNEHVTVTRVNLAIPLKRVVGSLKDRDGIPMIWDKVEEFYVTSDLLHEIKFVVMKRGRLYAKTRMLFDISRETYSRVNINIMERPSKVWLVDMLFINRSELLRSKLNYKQLNQTK